MAVVETVLLHLIMGQIPHPGVQVLAMEELVVVQVLALVELVAVTVLTQIQLLLDKQQLVMQQAVAVVQL